MTLSFGEEEFCAICPVCFWENAESGPNGLTLERATGNFEKFSLMD